MSSNIILILGAGPNIGLHITKFFHSKSYHTAVVARNPSEELIKAADLVIKADFSDATNIRGIFDEVKEKLGVPNVVVYNGVVSHTISSHIHTPPSSLPNTDTTHSLRKPHVRHWFTIHHPTP